MPDHLILRELKGGAKRIRAALVTSRQMIYTPKPILTISQWANKHAFLSPETSAQVGKFTSFRYQDGIMDAVGDPAVKQVTVQKSARIGYTRSIDNVIGFFIAQDPSPILVVQPRIEDSEDFSRTEIGPMLRDTPALSAIAGNIKLKDAEQRIAKRIFRNGASVSFVGANSPAGFRRITARVILFDEIDAYPVEGAGLEGDQITLGITRGQTFWNRRIAVGSTPTIKGISRIEKMFAESDQRYFLVPCPHCGHRQKLIWANLKWDRSEDGGHLPATAYYVCGANGCIVTEDRKPWMIANGEWVAEMPFTGHAGFFLNALYSLFPNASWPNLAKEWLRVYKDPVLHRTFINTVLAETWEDLTEKVEGHSLVARCEAYGPDSLPIEVRFLTAGVDTQGDRLELQVIGWGAGEEFLGC